jgi:DNA-binding transcriptional LysR family regulator
MFSTRISLDQWRALIAVVDAGGYAQAAAALNKSQSAVTYAVKKIETSLKVAAFRIDGRKARLTATGELLYRRARLLIEEAERLERTARTASAGWEALIGISVEVLFPIWLLLECLQEYGEESPNTQIEVYESVMTGAQEDLLQGRSELALTPHLPTGFFGDPILRVHFVPVAHPEHPLHLLGRSIEPRDLRRHRHILVRESSARRESRVSMNTEQRWTVGNMATSIGAVCRGHGFAWFPKHKITSELARGQLKVLPLAVGRDRYETIYLVLADPAGAGPGVRRLAHIIQRHAGQLD